ncbi:nitrate ABC transporter substrate-binding protein [Cryobacterium melibiosiphilum]|uniref:Nitrate ABC transporter substrate-binding protein n=1 Tax=Cryobacterium melibiosiphilum TaxID=995039 RepID=A0A3A5MC51_9MICO|nr:ABC transporter substrate-binding protein [Cryobacterium melibiosiphilum]RJT85154.1 nitrate ABC transporter substrate-binding protein [Cryobacterium melibiosiphilum]
MKKKFMIGLAAASVIALSACSAGTDATTPAADGDALTPVTVGVIPIADTAPLYLGLEQGFFEEEGLKLTIETATGGAAIVPAVVSGDYEFGFSNLISLMVANDKGLPLEVVSPAVASTGDVDSDFGAVIVKGDSPVTSLADLDGGTVSGNSLNNIVDTVMRSSIDRLGGDSSSISFVEIPFPDASAAVENGQVDAAFVVEPFVTAALESGQRVISYGYADFDVNLDVAAYFSSAATVSADPEMVTKFQAAMTKSLEYAQANPDAVRAIIATFTATPEEVLAKIVLPKFPTEFNVDAVTALGDAALEYGVVETAPDMSTFLP